MSPILFFIIFFICTGVGKIFLQINSAAVAFIDILIAAWEGLVMQAILFSWFSWGRTFHKNKSPWKFCTSIKANEACKINTKIYRRKMTFHRWNEKVNRFTVFLSLHGWLRIYIEDIWVFQCKIEFYFTEWTPQAVFSWVAVATSENTNCGVHEWNKIQSYTEKIKFSVSFMLLLAIIMFLPTRQLSRQKTYFYPSHFASVLSCSACGQDF